MKKANNVSRNGDMKIAAASSNGISKKSSKKMAENGISQLAAKHV